MVRDAFRARVADALQHLAERDDAAYDQLDLIAYSFGSVVALDAILPRADAPGPAFEDVETLVTVGCPYDLMGTYWPAYHTERHQRPGVPRHWLNVFSPQDVFGSNFEANDGSQIGVGVQGSSAPVPSRDEPGVGVTVPGDADPIKFWQILGIPGMKAHATYWEGEHDESVFARLVRRLYSGKPLLA